MCDVLVDFTHNDLNVGHHLDSDCMKMVTDMQSNVCKMNQNITGKLRREKHACLWAILSVNRGHRYTRFLVPFEDVTTYGMLMLFKKHVFHTENEPIVSVKLRVRYAIQYLPLF